MHSKLVLFLIIFSRKCYDLLILPDIFHLLNSLRGDSGVRVGDSINALGHYGNNACSGVHYWEKSTQISITHGVMKEIEIIALKFKMTYFKFEFINSRNVYVKKINISSCRQLNNSFKTDKLILKPT